MSSTLELSVVTWNILSDEPGNKDVSPQAGRLASIVQALGIARPAGFDVISLSEVELSADNNCAPQIAGEVGADDHETARHVGKTDGLLLAVQSPWSKPEATLLDPEHGGRAAVGTILGNTMVVGVHLSHEASRTQWRKLQVAQVLGWIGKRQAIIMGDLNCLRIQQPRRGLAALGFASVTAALGKPLPPATFPTRDYRRRTVKGYQQPFVGLRGLSIDDIYYSEEHFELIDAGRLRGESDHWGVWATLRQRLAKKVQKLGRGAVHHNSGVPHNAAEQARVAV